MTENQAQNQPQNQPQQPRAGRSSSSRPEVFGDGSTREQQDQLVKEAKQANAETKQYADADREFRAG